VVHWKRNEVCKFLLNKEIPKHITGLPAEFLGTPLGRALLPYIQSMFGDVSHLVPHQELTTVTSPKLDPERQPMHRPSTMNEVLKLVDSHRCVALVLVTQAQLSSKEFFSEFEQLIRSKYGHPYKKEFWSFDKIDIVGCIVDVGLVKEVPSKYQVGSAPSIIMLHYGQKVNIEEHADSIDL
jgi:hypothetical protein